MSANDSAPISVDPQAKGRPPPPVGVVKTVPQGKAIPQGKPVPRAVPLPAQQEAGASPVPKGQALSVRAEPTPARTARPTNSSTASQPVPTRPIPVGRAVQQQYVDDERRDEDGEKEPVELAVRTAPPWLVSMLVHAIMLIALGLWYLPNLLDGPVEIEAVYAEEEGEQLIDDQLDMATLEPLDKIEPLISEDIVEVVDPLAAPPMIDQTVLDATTSSSDIKAPSVGIALSGREKGMKKALLAAYGGTAKTEAAVLAALKWLKRNQQKDGSWSLEGPYSSAGNVENTAAATAMALLAFQGAGHTHKSGEFKNVVAKGSKILLEMQDEEGNFFREGPHHHRLYTQAQCSIAVCELYGMTKDPKFKEPAQRALNYAVKYQAAEGGWRYTPGDDSDTSVTGWFVMALQSGKMAGLEAPSPTDTKVMEFLDKVAHDGGRRYAYKIGQQFRLSMTAEALLCRQYLGWKRDDERLVDGVNYLNTHRIHWGGDEHNVYYWYYATQVTHHMEGDAWDKWNSVMRNVLPRNQTKTGKERGSWSPTEDMWGIHGGRLYTTCLCAYMLEVYYRHLPIYKYRTR